MILVSADIMPACAPLPPACHAATASHVALGTVPDWIGAIGTTMALFVAFAVFSLDVKERRRRQASQVAAWFERRGTGATLHVANSSDVPIYNVRVDPKLLGQVDETIRYPVLGPNAHETGKQIPMPGSSHVSNRYFNVEMYFADSAGRSWQRKANGKLRRRYRNYT